MGALLSCRRCRRRKLRSQPEDHEPLLSDTGPNGPENGADNNEDRDRIRAYHFADVVAAIHSGKLPSQAQLNQFLQRTLHSGVFDATSASNSAFANVIRDSRAAIEAAILLGLEKNDDDVLQEIVYQASQLGEEDELPIQVDTEVAIDKTSERLAEFADQAGPAPAPPEINKDLRTFAMSVKSVLVLLITSASFRLLLGSILDTFRDLLGEAAVRVGNAAVQVQVGAGALEETTRMDVATASTIGARMADAFAQAQEAGMQESRTMKEEGERRLKEVAIGRIQEIFIQAHQDQRTLHALNTILNLVNKYTSKVRQVSTAMSNVTDSPVIISPHVTFSPAFAALWSDVQALLYRFGPFEAVEQSFSLTISDALSAPATADEGLRSFLSSLQSWIETALANPRFATSHMGTRSAESLYDQAFAISNSESHAQWSEHLASLIQSAFMYTEELKSNRSLLKFLEAMDNLSVSSLHLATTGHISVWRELVSWAVPRALRLLKGFPFLMPRIEVISGSIKVAIETLHLGAGASLIPDHVSVQNWTELCFDMTADGNSATTNPGMLFDDSAPMPRTTTSDRLQVHVDGLRLAISDIAYYLSYTPFSSVNAIGYTDEGLLDVDVGRPGHKGEGLSLDVDITYTTPKQPDQPLFTVNSVSSSLPGLAFQILNSRHYILNTLFLQPLAAPVISTLLSKAVEEYVRTGLDSLERAMRSAEADIAISYRGDERTLWPAYTWSVLKNLFLVGEQQPSADGTRVESHTKATMKGVVYSTTTVDSHGEVQDQTWVTVGAGAQILPEQNHGPSGMHVTRQVIEEVSDEVHGVVEQAEDAAARARRTRTYVEEAGNRMQIREEMERERGGWRSNAFDL